MVKRSDAPIPFSKEKTYRLVGAVVKSQDIVKLRKAISALMDYIEGVEKNHRSWICMRLVKSLMRFARPYATSQKPRGFNVIIIPPHHAVTMSLWQSIPTTSDPKLLLPELKRFYLRCKEFREPVEEIITEDELFAVIEAAQSHFRLMDIITHKRPLKIFFFNCSHMKAEAECGLTEEGDDCCGITLFHPLNTVLCNRVSTFAHELGHAFNIALTGSIDILPDWFDNFNAKLGITDLTHEQKQEAFAELVGYAILSATEELKEFLPDTFNKKLSPLFVAVLKKITSSG